MTLTSTDTMSTDDENAGRGTCGTCRAAAAGNRPEQTTAVAAAALARRARRGPTVGASIDPQWTCRRWASASIRRCSLRSTPSRCGRGSPDALYGVSPFDVVTFAGVTAVLAAATVAASAGPLWRAARVDPVVALRE
jgi:hypothetical protein